MKKHLHLFSIFTFLITFSYNSKIFAVKYHELHKTGTDSPFSHENIILLLKSVSSLYSSLEIFDAFKNQLNIDGLLGVRILNDQLDVSLEILNRFGTQKLWNQIIGNSLWDLREKSEELLTTVLPIISFEDKNYFNEIGVILEKGLWSHFPDGNLSVNKSKEYKFKLNLDEITLNENISDLCVSQMLKRCNLSDFCWKIMTSFGYKDYPLSHQVFYLEMTKINCKTESLKKSFDNLLTIFCSNMYLENEEIEDKSYPEEYFDLFMENIAFCGIIGFKEFTANKRWLKKILSKQNSIGCYMKDIKNSKQTKPKKRREKILENGCSSHKTSMALASTVVYIRDIILEFVSFGVKDMIALNDNNKY